MSFPSVKNFDISFVQRTRDNLTESKVSKVKYDFTMLLNSLLGLIIVPNEINVKDKRKFSFDFFAKNLSAFDELKEIFSKKSVTLLNEKGREYQQKKFYWLSQSGNELSINDVTLEQFLKRIRNVVAHFGIIPTKDDNDNDWKGIIIRNFPENQTKPNLEIYLEQQEIETIAGFISLKFIQTATYK